MAFDESELTRYRELVGAFVEKRRPPEDVRPKLDIGFRVSGQSVEIYEIRPRFQKPTVKGETPVAKATFVRTQRVWKVFWMRSDLKWHAYEPRPQVRRLQDFLRLVDEDSWGCFWG